MMKYPLVPGDISTAFLHAKIPDGETILARPPITDRKPGGVWRLRQALYGLRNALRWFQEHLSATLEREGFIRLQNEPMMFYQASTGTLMNIHADDILLCCDPSILQEAQDVISRCFKVKWNDPIGEEWARYLGREWRWHDGAYEVRVPPSY